jgi:DNA-binding response OmpR family regulator
MADIRVLIVEDDPFIAMDIESAVAEQLGDGVELIVVESVAEARRMTAERLACALLDIDVVGGKTFDVASTLRDSGTPFAFVSGSAPHEVPMSLRDVRFLRKPFSTREVAAFVKSAVGMPRPEAARG